MTLMVVFAIGDSVFALAFFAILVFCLYGKSDGVLGQWDTYQILRLTLTKRVGWNLFKEACGTCTYGSFCHVSNIEDTTTLLLYESSPTFPPFLHLSSV